MICFGFFARLIPSVSALPLDAGRSLVDSARKLTTDPFYLRHGAEAENQMGDYISDDEDGAMLQNPQAPAPDWSRGRTLDHPLSESDGEVEEASPASPACAV